MTSVQQINLAVGRQVIAMRRAIARDRRRAGAVGVRAARRRRRPAPARRRRRRPRRPSPAPAAAAGRRRHLLHGAGRSAAAPEDRARSQQATWSATVRTTGTVDWDNDHTTQAITQVSGPIARIVADTGTRVKAGDPLLYVASGDMTNAMSTYRKAKNRFDLAKHQLDRNKDLFDHKALSQRDYEVGAGRLQRRGDRSAGLAAGAEDLRRARRPTSPRPSSRTCRSGRSW